MRFFYSECPAEPGGEFELERDEAAHLFVTLRAKVGETVGVLDGRGNWGVCEVMPGKRLKVLERHQAAEPLRKVHLFCAAPRRKEFDQLLKQAVEVGVWSVHLLQCQRSVALPDGGAAERWQAMALEACKQSHNFFAPQIYNITPLKQAVELVIQQQWQGFFGAVRGTLPVNRPENGEYALFIGPEGGFTDDEEAFMTLNGIRPWRFGSCVMRLETAAVCGAAMLNAEWEMG